MATAHWEVDEDLQKLVDNLLMNLGLSIERTGREDYSFLRTDTFYIQVLKEILENSSYPFDEMNFERETRNLSESDRIQALINKLGSEILMVELNHIKGEKIAEGNRKHISDMVQLLDALWLNLNQPGDGEEEMMQYIESDINQNDSFTQEKELNNQALMGGRNHDDQAGDNLFDKMIMDGGLQEDESKRRHNDDRDLATGSLNVPVYREDPINYGGIQLEPRYCKPTKTKKPKKKKLTTQRIPNVGSYTVASRPKSAVFRSQKQEVVRRIEDNIYGVQTLKNLKTRKLAKERDMLANPGVVRHLNTIIRNGDGVEYDPILIDRNVETIREYLDAKRQETDVEAALGRQKSQYQQELRDFIAFNRKVAPTHSE